MKRIIFFDGVCTLCNGFIDFILKKDHQNRFNFSSLQSEFAKKHVPHYHQSLDTVVLLEGEKVYSESTAVLRILFELGGVYNIVAILISIIPKFIRDPIYRAIAKNRYRIFGKKDTCRLPTAEERKLFLD